MIITSRSRSRPGGNCLGLISPRTATLLLALLGLVAHIHTFVHLKSLQESFPDVPKRLPMLASSSTLASPTTKKAPSVSHLPTPLASSISSQSEANEAAAGSYWSSLQEDGRWFNLLSNSSPRNSSPADDQSQDEERRSWEAAKTLARLMRGYAALSALACLLGIVGVTKSHLLSTRIFVLASFLDVFLCALSLLSLSLLATYPEIRALACDQVSSGEIQATLSFFHARPPPPPSSSNGSAALSPRRSVAASFVDDIFRRNSADREVAASSDVSTVWWDAVMDNVFASENCDEVFATTVVPLILVFSFVYLALR